MAKDKKSDGADMANWIESSRERQIDAKEQRKDDWGGRTAQEMGYRNSLDRNFGKKYTDGAGERGHGDADSKGRYTAREVISEVRNRKDDYTAQEQYDYFRGLQKDGTKFNARAEKYLDQLGERLGGGSGGGEQPAAGGGREIPYSPEAAQAASYSRAYDDWNRSGNSVQMTTGYNPVTGEYGFEGKDGRTPGGDLHTRYKALLKYNLGLAPAQQNNQSVVRTGGLGDEEQDNAAVMPTGAEPTALGVAGSLIAKKTAENTAGALFNY